MLPVLLLLRVGISKFLREDGTKRTTTLAIRLWQLPPTPIYSSIQPSCSIVFAAGFIITYWTLLQKESSNWLLLVTKMGSRQKAVKAFLAVCDDTMMLDRWIPDEDWIRQIRDKGGSDCSISHLNMGMSKQCMWQNNCATLLGKTIFYNKKNVQILKNKVTKNRLAFTMFWELIISQLQPFQATKASTSRFGTTLRGATAPSSEQPRH